ncbi:Vps62-related protein [bacterium]
MNKYGFQRLLNSIVFIHLILFIMCSTLKSNVNISSSYTQTSEVEQSIINEIVERYAPVLYFSKDEDYFPIEVGSFFDHSQLMKRRAFPFKDQVMSDTVNPALFTLYSNDDFYIRLKKDTFKSIKENYKNTKDKYRKTVYSNVIRIDEHPTVSYVVQYWLFFWGSKAGSINLTWHQCDWEMFMISLNETFEPIEAGYSQHYYGDVKTWAEVCKHDVQPVVYVARGSHALYFTPGKHKAYYDNGKKWRLGNDICETSLQWTPDDYQVVILNDSLKWLNFEGYWGSLTTTKLQGPKYRNPKDRALIMWENPVGWFEKYKKP